MDLHHRWPAKFPDRPNITLSENVSRSEMHKLLGKPIVTSSYWGVDLFRDTSSESDAVFVILFVFPLPMGIFTDEINQYTLVAYDQNDVAVALDKGIHRKTPFWRGPIEPSNFPERTLDLNAGDVTFSIEVWRVDKLLVTARRRDAYLELVKTSSYCTAVIACKSDKCSDTLRVDKGEAISLPGTIRRYDSRGISKEIYDSSVQNPIVAISLSPGEHVLEISDSRFFGGKGSIAVSCGKGDVVYFVTDSDRKFSYKLDCTLAGFAETYCSEVGAAVNIKQIEKNIPEFLGARSLIIWSGGKWIVKPEPENLDTVSGK